MSDLFIDSWGAGTPAVLAHGSLATGAEEWEAQRPLADEGFRLLVLDRRGYGQSPSAEGEDFLRDGDDIAEVMDDGAHLLGHSYGGLGVLFAAARRPDATRSLALLEPGTFALGQSHAGARSLVDGVRRAWDLDLPDDEWVVGFLKAVGSDPDEFPAEFLAAAVPLVPVFRRGRPMWYPDLPLAELAAARFPTLVVSGGHSAGFDAIAVLQPRPADVGVLVYDHVRDVGLGEAVGGDDAGHPGTAEGLSTSEIGDCHAPADYRAPPRVTFTDPEIGAVGLTEAQARQAGIAVHTGVAPVPSTAQGGSTRPATTA